MNRLVMAVAVLSLATWAAAQGNAAPGAQPGSAPQQQPNASGQAGQSGAPPQTAAPTTKRPPQAKSQDEFKAYQAAVANTDPAALEKAADDFAAKFPNSELRLLLYQKAMQDYQNSNNADKASEMAQKAIAIDPDNPQALILRAEILSEKSRQTDLDFNEKTAEAVKDAQHALETIDSDLMVSPNAPPEKVQEAKNWLRSTAYAVIGNVEMSKKDYASAERDLKKAIELTQNQPDPVNYLRLSVALDNQQKYAEALAAASKASQLAPENTQVGQLARQEENRLKQLSGSPSSSNTPAAAPKPASPAPTSPQPETPHR